MRIKVLAKAAFILIGIAVSMVPAVGQSISKNANQQRPDLDLGYSYLRSNAPPGGCTCINLNGGNATFAWPLKTGLFALAGDVSAAHAGNISSGGYSLTLSSYTAGLRVQPWFAHSSLHPFGEALIGLAHSSGTLVEGPTATAPHSTVTFATNLGGGLDLGVSRRLSWRMIEADYLLTTFSNGGNNHQNNLHLSTGVVIHF
jgi:outer membrane immunogenic protein